MSATADQLRNRKILVKVDGDLTITCRRPDPLALIADGTLQLPIFAKVLDQITAAVQAVFDDDVSASTETEDFKQYRRFVDRWVCAAAVKPRVVLTEAEAILDPASMWVQDLEDEVRYEIVRRTNRAFASTRLRTAVMDFRRHQSVGADARPDGAAVREDPVPAFAGA